MDLNKVMLIGNITQDPEMRTTPQGTAVTSFGLATNLSWTDTNGVRQSKAEFHNIVAWRKLAEICGQYLKKGKRIYIEGRLQTRDWEDQNGVRRYKAEIIAENMIMLDRMTPPGSTGIPGQTAANTPAMSSVSTPSSTSLPQTPADGEIQEDNIRIEDIPF